MDELIKMQKSTSTISGCVWETPVVWSITTVVPNMVFSIQDEFSSDLNTSHWYQRWLRKCNCTTQCTLHPVCGCSAPCVCSKWDLILNIIQNIFSEPEPACLVPMVLSGSGRVPQMLSWGFTCSAVFPVMCSSENSLFPFLFNSRLPLLKKILLNEAHLLGLSRTFRKRHCQRSVNTRHKTQNWLGRDQCHWRVVRECTKIKEALHIWRQTPSLNKGYNCSPYVTLRHDQSFVVSSHDGNCVISMTTKKTNEDHFFCVKSSHSL